MLKRMTDYTLAQLIEASKKKSGPSCGGYHGVHSCCGALITPVAKIPADELPIGAIMNEIGTIFLNDGTPEAEDALAKLFDNVDEPIIASVAYFYFSQKMDALKPENRAKAEKYAADPANAERVEGIKNKIRQYTAETAV